MRVLVTGATGFIGGKLVDSLVADGHEVRVLVRPGREGRFASQSGIEPCHGDLADAGSLITACAGMDAVVHSAGALGRWGVSEDDLAQINVRGVTRLVEACAKGGVTHFVHLSAGGVSGPMEPVPADETFACDPKTPYERTKLAGENAAADAAKRLGVPLTILRPTFTYGPGDAHKLPMFKAVKSGKMFLVGDGSSLIHPVFVDDLVHGIRLALDRPGRGETYILGGPRPVTKRELLDTIAENVGVRRRWLRLPRGPLMAAAFAAELLGRIVRIAPPLTRGRVLMMGWSFGYRIDKAGSDLGYRPQTSFSDGVRRTADWYREHGWIS